MVYSSLVGWMTIAAFGQLAAGDCVLRRNVPTQGHVSHNVPFHQLDLKPPASAFRTLTDIASHRTTSLYPGQLRQPYSLCFLTALGGGLAGGVKDVKRQRLVKAHPRGTNLNRLIHTQLDRVGVTRGRGKQTRHALRACTARPCIWWRPRRDFSRAPGCHRAGSWWRCILRK
jgi:hypothetical protein